MEMTRQKFEGFKIFLEPHVKDTTYSIALKQSSLELFLSSLEQYQDKSADEIVSIISDKFNVNLDDYSQADKDRFGRYIDYFQKVAKICK